MKITKLDFSAVPSAGVLVFIGRTNSGKTILIREVMRQKCQEFTQAIVMTGSATAAKEFSEHVPDVFVYDGFDEAKLEAIVSKQDRDQKLGKCKPILIVLDDLAYLSDQLKNLDVMRRIFYNGRHYKILLLLSFQYIKAFPPAYRDQVMFVFCTANKNPKRRAAVFETFNNVFEDLGTFDSCMVALTQDYRAMVLDHCSNSSTKIEENVYWCKAPYPPTPWRMNNGGACWRRHKQRYDAKYFLRPPKVPESTTKRKRKTKSLFTVV